MSTKKTREAIAALRTVAGGSGIMRQVIQDALAEIEALERASRFIVADREGVYVTGVDIKSSWLMIESIAKEAP